MNLEELEDKYNNWIEATTTRTHFKKVDFYEEKHIFDENMSVKWNREKVKTENQRMETINKLQNERINVLMREYEDALKQFLLTDEEFGNGQLTEKQLEEIQGFMMKEFDDDMNFYTTMLIYKKLIRLIFTCMKG